MLGGLASLSGGFQVRNANCIMGGGTPERQYISKSSSSKTRFFTPKLMVIDSLAAGHRQ